MREPGDIEKVSVAVLINGIYNVAEDGTVDYTERDAEELARLEELVRTSIGFDDTRGDSVSVVSLRFMDYSMDVGEPVSRSATQVLADNVTPILRGMFALALVAAVLGLGVRPALRRVMEVPAPAAVAELPDGAGKAGVPALPGQAGAGGVKNEVTHVHHTAQAQGGQHSVHHTGTVLDPLPHGQDDLMHIASVEGGVQRGWISTVSDMIEREPEDALKVVKSWLAEGA